MILIGDLPPFKNYCGLYFVSFCNEGTRMPNFELEIVCVCIGMKPDFFDERDVLMFFLKLLLLGEFVLILPEIHELANRWIRRRDDLNKIEPPVHCKFVSFFRHHHSNLFPVVRNDPHLWCPNFRVDPRALLLDRRPSYDVVDFCLISSVTLRTKEARSVGPKSPLRCLRTATVLFCTSFAPTTSM